MNWKTWVPLILAAILGLIAAKAGRDIIVKANSTGVTQGRFTKIVVSKADLSPGHALTQADLALASVSTESVPRTAFLNTADLEGRVVVQPMIKGQAILESFLAPNGAGAGMQGVIPAGMRAMTLEVNEVSSVGGLLAPGCRVDVVITLQDDTTSQSIARTLVENVRVLAVGQRITPASQNDKDEPARAKSVTLLVFKEDVEAIELASRAGQTRLVLRGTLDSQTSGTQLITLAELLGHDRPQPQVPVQPVIAATQPVKPPTEAVAGPRQPTRWIETIRNGAVSRIEMPLPTESQPSALTGENNNFVFPRD